MGSKVEGQFAFEVEGYGACESYVGKGVACGLEIDFEIASAGSKESVAGDDGAGGYAGAAGECLILYATFVGADEKTAVVQIFDKVYVGTIGT